MLAVFLFMNDNEVRANADMNIERDVNLAPFTTFGIGGPARFFVTAETEDHVAEAFEFASRNKLELFVLGGGSNVLISDTGFNGLVLQIGLKGISTSDGGNGKTIVTAAAGEDWDPFVEFCVEQFWAGFECLSGIPGFVGGTPVQNVGAYGQEVSETIISVRCFDRASANIVELTNAECGFGYRKSSFNTSMRDCYIVLGVTYALQNDCPPKIVYKDLIDFVGESESSLRETREAVLTIRRAKSMVIEENDPNSRSAGSFFKNPIVAKIRAEEIENAPQFKIDEETVKIPAAWLIEQSGFHKGYRLGNAGISTNHSLAIVNIGNASADEIVILKDLIQTEVEKSFGILLQPEPVFVGFR